MRDLLTRGGEGVTRAPRVFLVINNYPPAIFGLMAPFGPDRRILRFPRKLVAFGVIWGYLHVNVPIFHTNRGDLHVKRLAGRLANLG